MKPSKILYLFGFLAFLPNSTAAQLGKIYSGYPQWTVTCDLDARDKFGDRKSQHCLIRVHNDAGYYDRFPDGTYVLNLKTVVRVDETGVHLLRGNYDYGCRSRPQRIAVDGRRIDGISELTQIQALKSGKVLVREEQTDFPYCALHPQMTNLTGIGDAIDRAQRQFNSRKK